MKKIGLIILSVLILFLFPIISAVEFDMKDEFHQGETLLAKVSGNFIDSIQKQNVFFYRRHIQIPLDFEVKKINNDFYISASLLDKIQDNYSIIIKDTPYLKGSQISKEDIIKNFTITNKTADFSVKPGFMATNTDFFVEVQNLQDFEITLKIKTTSKEENKENIFSSLFGDIEDGNELSLNLKSGEIKKLNFELKNINESIFKIIEFKTDNLNYNFPLYIYANQIEIPKNNSLISGEFRFEPSFFEVNLSTNSETTRIIYLKNIGQEDMENISLIVSESLSKYLFLSTKEIKKLKENSSAKIEIYFIAPEDENNLVGELVAKKSQEILTFTNISLNFIKDFIPLENSSSSSENISSISPISRTCSELQGSICNEDEECEGEQINAKDNSCCLGTCDTISESPTGKIIGWTIIIVILGVLIWVYKSYKKKS